MYILNDYQTQSFFYKYEVVSYVLQVCLQKFPRIFQMMGPQKLRVAHREYNQNVSWASA